MFVLTEYNKYFHIFLNLIFTPFTVLEGEKSDADSTHGQELGFRKTT
jgi:hypothetical protein